MHKRVIQIPLNDLFIKCFYFIGFSYFVVLYIVKNPNAGYVTYAFDVWLYKCSFRGRSLNKVDKA